MASLDFISDIQITALTKLINEAYDDIEYVLYKQKGFRTTFNEVK